MIPAGIEETAASSATDAPEPDQGVTAGWEPVLPIWRFWVLSIVTLATYLPFWVAGVARELRRQRGPRIRPWLYVMGFLAGVTAPVVVAMLCRHVDHNAQDRGLSVGPPRFLIVALSIPAAAFALVGMSVADAVATTPRQAFNATWLLLAGFAVLVPLPAALLQWKLNRLKQAIADPERPKEQQKFTATQFAIFAFGSIAWLLAMYASPLDRIFITISEIQGESIIGNSEVSGPSGGYRLTVRTDDWMRMPPYATAKGADLELHGPSDAAVLVYVHSSGRALGDIVTFRRRAVRNSVADFIADDQLPGSKGTVSHARYGGVSSRDFRDTTWWVTTMTTISGAVEVVGTTSGSNDVQSEVEMLVRSLQLEPADGK